MLINSIMSSSKDILNTPSEWPESFPKPIIGTRVLTFVFNTDPSIDIFLNFVKDKFPQALLNVVEDGKGFTIVSITEITNSEPTLNATAQKCLSPDCPAPKCPSGDCRNNNATTTPTLDATTACISDDCNSQDHQEQS